MFINQTIDRLLNVRIIRCTDSTIESTEEDTSSPDKSRREVCRTCRQGIGWLVSRRGGSSNEGTGKLLERAEQSTWKYRKAGKEAKTRLMITFFPFFSFFNNYTTYLMMIDFSLIGYDIGVIQ